MSSSIEIMVNKCFGGFGFSKQAVDTYLHRTRTLANADVLLAPNTTTPQQEEEELALVSSDRAINAYTVERHDPVMIQIVKELGDKAHGFCAEISIQRVPAQYVRHYSIEDYDGSETVVIHHDKYKVDSAKAILHNVHLTSMEKLARISAVLHTPPPKLDSSSETTTAADPVFY